MQYKKSIWIPLALVILLCSPFVPAPVGLPPAGMQVLFIFMGVLLLWLTTAIDWPSLLCLGALAMVPGLKMDGILASSFGNSTFAFLLFTFLCTYALAATPFIRRCALGFVTGPLAQKGPWAFVCLYFASILFVGAFISPTVLFVLYLPITEELFAVLGLEKGDKTASMLMMGLVFCCGISSGMTPIAHVFPLMALSYYQTATGMILSQNSFMLFAIPVGLLTTGAMLLLFRLLLRPKLSALAPDKTAALVNNLGPMGLRERLTLGIFSLVVFLWVAPTMLKDILPAFYGAINPLGTAFPPLVGAVLLCLITVQGKPLLHFKEAMEKGVPWGSLIICAATLALGSAMTNPEIGLTRYLSEQIAPLAAAMAPMALVFLFLLWAAIQTNLSSNMVTVTVVTAIAVPICLALPGIHAGAVCALIGILASYAFATPPAMPCVAIAGASGWTTAADLLKYGSLLALVAVGICLLVGYPIAQWVL